MYSYMLRQLSFMTDAFYYYHMTVSKSVVCIPVHDIWKINKWVWVWECDTFPLCMWTDTNVCW